MLAAPLATEPWVVAVLLFVTGIGFMGWNVVTVSLRQRIVPERLLGRLNASYRLVAWGTMPLGAALGGVLAEVFGLRSVFAVTAVIALGARVLHAAADERQARRGGGRGRAARRRPRPCRGGAGYHPVTFRRDPGRWRRTGAGGAGRRRGEALGLDAGPGRGDDGDPAGRHRPARRERLGQDHPARVAARPPPARAGRAAGARPRPHDGRSRRPRAGRLLPRAPLAAARREGGRLRAPHRRAARAAAPRGHRPGQRRAVAGRPGRGAGAADRHDVDRASASG